MSTTFLADKHVRMVIELPVGNGRYEGVAVIGCYTGRCDQFVGSCSSCLRDLVSKPQVQALIEQKRKEAKLGDMGLVTSKPKLIKP